MNISRESASRSRSGESCAFSDFVSRQTAIAASTDPPASPKAWIRPFRTRLLTEETDLSKSEVWILTTLLEYVDPDGRCWPSLDTIAQGARLSLQTARAALQTLEINGWLSIDPHTWTTLTQEQAALGRPIPGRDHGGQAPNLYVVLDGTHHLACNPARLRLARVALLSASPANSQGGPCEKPEGGPYEKPKGEPLVKVTDDLDHSEDRSKKVSVEQVSNDTHTFSKSQKTDEGALEAWEVVAKAHDEKSISVHRVGSDDLGIKREIKCAVAKCLDGVALEVRATIHARTDIARDFADVRLELAKRVMALYFANTADHLRKTKHALRDLPLEFRARLIEARQALLRESHDAAEPRRPALESSPTNRVSSDKPAEIQPLERNSARELTSTAKPREGMSASTVVEAKRVLEVLAGLTKPELVRPSTEQPPPRKPTPTEEKREAQAHVDTDKPTQDTPLPGSSRTQSFEQQSFEDKASRVAHPEKPTKSAAIRAADEELDQDKPTNSPHGERPLGRSGAPRLVSIGPRPIKVREVKKLLSEEAGSDNTEGITLENVS